MMVINHNTSNPRLRAMFAHVVELFREGNMPHWDEEDESNQRATMQCIRHDFWLQLFLLQPDGTTDYSIEFLNFDWRKPEIAEIRIKFLN